MTMRALNTLAYAKKLIAAGVPERQAEALAEIVEDTLATKLDIKALESAMKEQDRRLLREMKDIECRMTIKLGALKVVAVGAMATLQKLL